MYQVNIIMAAFAQTLVDRNAPEAWLNPSARVSTEIVAEVKRRALVALGERLLESLEGDLLTDRQFIETFFTQLKQHVSEDKVPMHAIILGLSSAHCDNSTMGLELRQALRDLARWISAGLGSDGSQSN